MYISIYVYLSLSIYIYIYYIFRRIRLVYTNLQTRSPKFWVLDCKAQGSRKRSVFFTDTGTANLRTKILDLRGFDSRRISNSRGWNSHVHRGFPGNLESTNLSRDNLSRDNLSSEIGDNMNIVSRDIITLMILMLILIMINIDMQ